MATSGKKTGFLSRIVDALTPAALSSEKSQKSSVVMAKKASDSSTTRSLRAKAKKAAKPKSKAKTKSKAVKAKAAPKKLQQVTPPDTNSNTTERFTVDPVAAAHAGNPARAPGRLRINVMAEDGPKGSQTRPQNESAVNRMARSDRFNRRNTVRRILTKP